MIIKDKPMTPICTPSKRKTMDPREDSLDKSHPQRHPVLAAQHLGQKLPHQLWDLSYLFSLCGGDVAEPSTWINIGEDTDAMNYGLKPPLSH